MREKLARFMVGRNGVDDLARFESWFVLVVLILSIFTRSGLLDLIAIALIVHMYFRVFSRNISKRYEENQKFLNFRYDWTVYKFYKCPMCRQEVRVPRGHGKICITCPKCREEFIRRS